MPRPVTVSQLRRETQKILRALEQGEHFVLVQDGRIIAQLTPVRDVTTAVADTAPHDSGASSPDLSVSEIVALLGEETISRIVGLTWISFAEQQRSNTFSPAVLQRLAALSEALAEQRTSRTPHQIHRWWHRANNKLDGHSPVEYLARPWKSGDAYSRKIFQLMRS